MKFREMNKSEKADRILKISLGGAIVGLFSFVCCVVGGVIAGNMEDKSANGEYPNVEVVQKVDETTEGFTIGAVSSIAFGVLSISGGYVASAFGSQKDDEIPDEMSVNDGYGPDGDEIKGEVKAHTPKELGM